MYIYNVYSVYCAVCVHVCIYISAVCTDVLEDIYTR